VQCFIALTLVAALYIAYSDALRSLTLKVAVFFNASRASTMSIKSDNWIRRMATEHAMIEPFEPHQVKEVDGRRVGSYGTSSYG
jgi:hypothetical protein